MFRVKFVFAFAFIFLVSSSSANQLLEQLATEVDALKQTVQGLTNRMNGARVDCQDKRTPLDVGSNKKIMYLDRQNVECPSSYFLARFHLKREGDYDSARVQYEYRCCKFVL